MLLLAIALLTPAPTSVQAALCNGRSPCFIARTQAAGAGADGLTLSVVELVLGARESNWREPHSVCVPYEVWVASHRGAQLESWQRVAALCNDGYGARGIGEDEIIVTPGHVDLAQTGGSAWGWSSGRRLQLSPLRVLQESLSGSWILGANTGSETWDWTTFSGRAQWFSPPCKADGTAPSTEIGGDGDPFESVLIPRVVVSDAYRATGWRGTPLGACATVVDASGRGGFVVHGTPGAPTDAVMKFVAIDARTLIVEVGDDRWSSGAASWLHEDHLEIWTGPALGYHDDCVDPSVKPLQWAVRLSDGHVFVAHGKPSTTIQVERQVIDATHVRMRLVMASDIKGISVVYSDSDDGRTQERLLATSALKHGVAATLGRLRTIPATHAVCDVRDGRLAVRETRVFE